MSPSVGFVSSVDECVWCTTVYLKVQAGPGVTVSWGGGVKEVGSFGVAGSCPVQDFGVPALNDLLFNYVRKNSFFSLWFVVSPFLCVQVVRSPVMCEYRDLRLSYGAVQHDRDSTRPEQTGRRDPTRTLTRTSVDGPCASPET